MQLSAVLHDYYDGDSTSNGPSIPDTPTELQKLYSVTASIVGLGTYGIVHRGHRLVDNVPVAVKIIHKNLLISDDEQRLVRSEIEIHETLTHDNIISLLNVFESDSAIYLISELIEGSDLEEYRMVQRTRTLRDDGTARALFVQFLRGLQYIHQLKVAHGDVKPSNVLLKADFVDNQERLTVKLCDFGLACKVTQQHPVVARGVSGTSGYLAPELLNDDAPGTSSCAADMWAAGVVMFRMFCNAMPFDTDSDFRIIKWPQDASLSSEVRSLISGLLTVDPIKRLSAAQALAHPWFATKSYTDGSHHHKLVDSQ